MRRKHLTVTLLLAVISSSGCRKTSSTGPSASTTAPAPNPYSTSFWASGWSYRLRPLKSEQPPKNTDEVKQVWRDLLTRMAKDEKTLELLKRLHGDLPIEFVVLDAKQTEDKNLLKAPPSDGKAVVMRVADMGQPDEKVAGDEFPVRVLAMGRAVLLKDAENPTNLEGLTENMKREPTGGGALTLAMKEYLFRHAVGYGLLSGPAEDEDLPKSIEEQRQTLDKQIKDHADHAKEFYESRRRKN